MRRRRCRRRRPRRSRGRRPASGLPLSPPPGFRRRTRPAAIPGPPADSRVLRCAWTCAACTGSGARPGPREPSGWNSRMSRHGIGRCIDVVEAQDRQRLVRRAVDQVERGFQDRHAGALAADEGARDVEAGFPAAAGRSSSPRRASVSAGSVPAPASPLAVDEVLESRIRVRSRVVARHDRFELSRSRWVRLACGARRRSRCRGRSRCRRCARP